MKATLLAMLIYASMASCMRWREEIVVTTGTVEDVLLWTEPIASNARDHAIAGAVIGGLVAGGVGAVVGAELGRQTPNVTTTGGRSFCRVIFQIDGQTAGFLFNDQNPSLDECRFLRRDDRVRMSRHTYFDRCGIEVPVHQYRWPTSA